MTCIKCKCLSNVALFLHMLLQSNGQTVSVWCVSRDEEAPNANFTYEEGGKGAEAKADHLILG